MCLLASSVALVAACHPFLDMDDYPLDEDVLALADAQVADVLVDTKDVADAHTPDTAVKPDTGDIGSGDLHDGGQGDALLDTGKGDVVAVDLDIVAVDLVAIDVVACLDTCGAGLQCCDSLCTDLESDAQNCGGCGTVCPQGVCHSGRCMTPCDPAACDPLQICLESTDGVAECWCGQEQCGLGGVCCRTSGLELACVYPGDANFCACGACTGTQTCCPTGCVDLLSLQTDATNCGSCGHICPAGYICQAGQCACQPGTGDCDGDPSNGCEALLPTAEYCGMTCASAGACGAGNTCQFLGNAYVCGCGDADACDPGESCIAGQCTCGGSACSALMVCCSTPGSNGNTQQSCVNPASDPLHCGGCGTFCPGAQCVGGSCLSG